MSSGPEAFAPEEVALPADPRVLDDLRRDGFAPMAALLGGPELRAVQDAAADLLSRPGTRFSGFNAYLDRGAFTGQLFKEPGADAVFLDFIGHSPVMDREIDRLLGSPLVTGLLTHAFGNDAVLASCQLREARPEGKGLHIHQDRPHELTLAILLSDASGQDGTTCFLPGSHRWPDVLDAFPLLAPGWLGSRLVGARGRAGDGYIFVSTLWHGRFKAERTRTAMILSFRPSAFASLHRWPGPDRLARLGPTLQRLLTRPPASVDASALPGREGSSRLWEKAPLPVLSPWHLAVGVASAGRLGLQAYRALRRAVRHRQLA